MDSRPDQEQYDQSHVELEITDIDAEEPGGEGDRSARPSKFEQLFSSMMRHARLWFVLASVAGCVVIAILIFPDTASLVIPVSTSPTPTSTAPAVQYSYVAMTGSDNVTFVLQQPQTGGQPLPVMRNTNVTAYDTRTGALLWRTSQPPTSSTSYGLTLNFSSQVALNIYALHTDGEVSLLAPRTGKVLWSYKLPSATVKSFAYEQDGVLFLPDSNQVMYAVKDGRMLWSSANFGMTLTIDDGVIYACDAKQQNYYALDEASGARLWTYSVPSSAQSTASNFPSFTVANKTFYLQTGDDKVLAIQSQGHVLWSHQFDNNANLRADAHHLYVFTPVVATLEVLNLQTGKQEHSNLPKTGIANLIDIQNNLLYTQTQEGELKAINVDTGSVVWKKALAANQTSGVLQGDLYILSSSTSSNGIRFIQAINERDGTVLWSKDIEGQLISVNGGMLNLMSQDSHTISVLRLSDGKILWSQHIG